jgi:hypothetical protein
MTEQPSRVLPPDYIALCDFQARKAVCAMRWNPKTKRDEIMGFLFHPLIADWPICQQAEREGWARELRSAMIATVKRMMFAGEAPDPARAIPSEKWIEDTRRHAERYRFAAEYQKNHMPDTFNARKFVGRILASGDGLTERSKAMTGDAA